MYILLLLQLHCNKIVIIQKNPNRIGIVIILTQTSSGRQSLKLGQDEFFLNLYRYSYNFIVGMIHNLKINYTFLNVINIKFKYIIVKL